MDDLESKLGAIMNDPDMMQKIMSMAQTLNGAQPKQESAPNPFPDIDISLLQKLSGFMGQSNIDSNQQNLLRALGPYLQTDRIHRLEKAMRAAKLARLASGFLGSGNFFGLGR